MSGERIRFKCPACGAELDSPAHWAGIDATCPVCGGRHVVPSAGDLPERREPALTPSEGMRRPDEQALRDWRARDGDMVINVKEGVISEPSAAARAARRPIREPMTLRTFVGRYKVYLIGGLVLIGLLGWWASWKWYYRNYVKAEAIMKNRGYGRQLSAPLTDDPRITGLVSRVDVAESRQFENPQDLTLSIELAAAYDDALKEIAHIRRSRANAILNNAAWLLCTSPHLGLRDPGRALKLAETAVVQTCRKEPGYLDTLAEALAVNGRTTEALDVAREALSKAPADQYLIDRERHFSDLASTTPVNLKTE